MEQDTPVKINKNYISGSWIYDTETYPNIFTFCAVYANGKSLRVYEISDRKNQTEELLEFIRNVVKNKHRFIGFNNQGFDYPILHWILEQARAAKVLGQKLVLTAQDIFDFAQSVIQSMRNDKFGKTVREDEVIVPQVDLFKIHHFDNKAKATSLKMLEFNMKSDNIEDLPFPVGKYLTSEEMDVLIHYNGHDVMETLKFYLKSIDAIRFRAILTDKYGFDCTNFNDTKIGKQYFINRLEKIMPGSCYKITRRGRELRQTKREYIDVNNIIFPYVKFERKEFQILLSWFRQQIITETKGVFSDIEEYALGDLAQYSELVIKRKKFKSKPTEDECMDFMQQHPLGWIETEDLKGKEDLLDEQGNPVYEYPLGSDGMPNLKRKPKKVKAPKKSYWGCWRVAETLNCTVDGFRFYFGTGGIHGSIESQIIKEDDEHEIVDADVASMYPNIAISNRVYPEHLGEKFCDIYKDIYLERKKHKKESPENAVLKLALNGVYGDSNNQYSPFYDPQYTMAITINGQLTLCLLVERLLKIDGCSIIQANTDGVTVKIKRSTREQYDSICKQWEQDVKLELEFNNYKSMFIRDVNNYIAQYTNGKVKRKGAYEYENLGWHQNQSCLVVQKAVEHELLGNGFIEDYVITHRDHWDFLLRTKVPRSSKLVMVMDDGQEVSQQNICRYYISKEGGQLIKIMPPLEGKEELGDRRMAVDKGWKVKTCNNIKDFSWDINYDYYIEEARKLVDPLLGQQYVC